MPDRASGVRWRCQLVLGSLAPLPWRSHAFRIWSNTAKMGDTETVDDYDAYSRVFARLAPPPIPLPDATSTLQKDDTVSTSANVKGPESSYTVRALPVLIYLPDGVPVIQEVVPPAGSDGRYHSSLCSFAREDVICRSGGGGPMCRCADVQVHRQR